MQFTHYHCGGMYCHRLLGFRKLLVPRECVFSACINECKKDGHHTCVHNAHVQLTPRVYANVHIHTSRTSPFHCTQYIYRLGCTKETHLYTLTVCSRMVGRRETTRFAGVKWEGSILSVCMWRMQLPTPKKNFGVDFRVGPYTPQHTTYARGNRSLGNYVFIIYIYVYTPFLYLIIIIVNKSAVLSDQC